MSGCCREGPAALSRLPVQGFLPALASPVSRSGQTRFALKRFFHWKIPLQPNSERLLFPLLFQQRDFLIFLVPMTGFHALPERMFPQSRNK